MSPSRQGPGDCRVPYPIVRARVGAPLRTVFLTEDWSTELTHNIGKKTCKCPGKEVCKKCLEGDPPRWQGYVLGKSWDGDTVGIIHLTARAGFMIEEWAGLQETMVGLRCVLTRTGDRINGPVSAACYGYAEDVEPIPIERLDHAVENIYRKNGFAPRLEQTNGKKQTGV